MYSNNGIISAAHSVKGPYPVWERLDSLGSSPKAVTTHTRALLSHSIAHLATFLGRLGLESQGRGTIGFLLLAAKREWTHGFPLAHTCLTITLLAVLRQRAGDELIGSAMVSFILRILTKPKA